MVQDYHILVASDCSVSVEFGRVISRETNRRVTALSRRLDAERLPGLVETVPSYRSLLVVYQPERLSLEELTRVIQRQAGMDESPQEQNGKRVELPVWYGGEAGPDLEFVAGHSGLGRDEVVEIHAGRDYPVYMLGFLPGFPYLGEMDKRIAAPRLPTPRVRIPAGSVGIAGEQTGVYPSASPGGWRLIGRTPLRLFNPEAAQPFLLEAGDLVRFVPVSREEFIRLGGDCHD